MSAAEKINPQAIQVVGWVFNAMMVVLLGLGAYIGRTGLEEVKAMREEMSSLKTEMAVSNQRIIQSDRNLEKIEQLQNFVRDRTEDRLTGSQFNSWLLTYETQVSNRFEKLITRIEDHKAESAHRESKEQHEQTQRRLMKLETQVDKLEKAYGQQ